MCTCVGVFVLDSASAATCIHAHHVPVTAEKGGFAGLVVGPVVFQQMAWMACCKV